MKKQTKLSRFKDNNNKYHKTKKNKMHFKIHGIDESGPGNIECYGLWKRKGTALILEPWQFLELRKQIDRAYHFAMINIDKLNFPIGDDKKKFINFYHKLSKHNKLNL